MSDARPQRPGLYYPKMSNTWWLKRPNYIRFMIREVTSVFIAVFLVVLLVQLGKLAQGPAAYEAFLRTLRAPGRRFPILPITLGKGTLIAVITGPSGGPCT